MNQAEQRGVQERLADRARERFERRKGERERRLDEVNAKGVLAAAGTTAALRRVAHMTVGEGRVFEARLGETDDLASINYLPRGQRASRSVCRLLRDGEWFGTGFLVAPGLLLTNNHVIESADEAARFTAEFGHELDIDDRPFSPVVVFALDPSRAFVTSSYEDGLDFTFVAVQPTSIQGQARIEDFGWLPMDERRDKILEGEPCVIIQHPLGEPKQICLFGSELVDRPDDYIQYMTDTDHGTSGSPVHNRHWQLIGLHHASTTSNKRQRGRDMAVNEGIRVSSMIRALRDGTHPLAAAGTVRPEEAAARVLSQVTNPAVMGDGRPMGPARPAAPDGRGAPAGGLLEARPTIIGRRPDSHFQGRPSAHHGYKERFLGQNHRVRLPQLLGALAGDAVRLIGNSSKVVLNYTHYSAVQSASRKMPIFTAVNINGARSQSLDRKDRTFEGRESVESDAILEAAADKWFFDPRIAESAQLEPPVFDQTKFAFGHVTRREDPVWGNLNTARMGNDDTFYMTNVATQHERFNSGIWLKLENAMLDAARRNRIKISVFSGPVLRPDDPEVLGVQVPTTFWKVVAWVEDGELHSRGYTQSQRALVDEIRRDLESLSALAPAEPFEAAIADIARMTSLDFGVLVAADEKAAGGPESRRGARLTEASVDSLVRSFARADRANDDGDDEYGADGGDSGRHGEGDRVHKLLVEILRNQERLLDLLKARDQ